MGRTRTQWRGDCSPPPRRLGRQRPLLQDKASAQPSLSTWVTCLVRLWGAPMPVRAQMSGAEVRTRLAVRRTPPEGWPTATLLRRGGTFEVAVAAVASAGQDLAYALVGNALLRRNLTQRLAGPYHASVAPRAFVRRLTPPPLVVPAGGRRRRYGYRA